LAENTGSKKFSGQQPYFNHEIYGCPTVVKAGHNGTVKMKQSSKTMRTINKPPERKENKYFPISPLILRTDSSSDFKVYLYHNDQYVLYTKERESFTPKLKNMLYENGTERIFVPFEQKKEYDNYVNENFETILNDAQIPIKERSRVFLDTSNNLIQEIFDNNLPSGVTKGYFEKVKKIVHDTLHFLSLKEAIENIGKLVSHDYKTYSHSVHVFTYTIALLHNHNFTDQEKKDVGIGALLHDIGKRKIAKRILNKPGRLDKDEWKIIKRHPVFGTSLCSNLSLSHLSLNCILFHHEKYDGSGYPTGLAERNIPFPVRYLTCCDVYDAITSDRPYAQAENAFNALKIMRNHMHGSFDMNVYKELVTLLSNTGIA